MKKTIEINDDLQERIDNAIDELKELIEQSASVEDEYLRLEDLDASFDVFDIVENEVPILTKQIEDLWYLYRTEFEETYYNTGIGDNFYEGNGRTAIFLYIEDKLFDWYNKNGKEYFNSLRGRNDS